MGCNCRTAEKSFCVPENPETLTFAFARKRVIQDSDYSTKLKIRRGSLVEDNILTSVEFPEEFVKEDLFHEIVIFFGQKKVSCFSLQTLHVSTDDEKF